MARSDSRTIQAVDESQAAGDEKTLIISSQSGNAAAFEALYRRHAPAALRVALLIAGDRGLAEDCLQEAAVRAWNAIARFIAERPFYPWFLKLTVNEALKARRRRLWHFAQLPTSLAAPPDPGGHEEGETRDAVARAMSALDPAHRAVLVLFYYLDLSEREIAATLGIRVTTVKSRLHTARGRLATRLRQEGFGHDH